MTSGKQTKRQRRDQPTPSLQEHGWAQPDALKSWQIFLPPGGQRTRLTQRDVLGILGLVLLVAVCYFPATQAGFVWDDLILTSSKAVKEWSGLWQFWFETETTYNVGNTREGHFWPLLYSTFWLEHKLWGFAPVGYHLVNLLLHVVNTWLVWRLLCYLAVPGAWLIAAVFAVHPVHVEAVTWVMARKDLLSTLFYLTAALTWLRFVEAPRAGRYVLALTLFVAGLLSKSMVVTLPAGLLIWHWWQQGRVTSTDVLRLLPFFLVGLGIGLADMSFFHRRETASFDNSVVDRVLISSRALWFYAGKVFWPADLAVIYPRWDIDPREPLGWAYVAAALALAVLLWFFRQRTGRGPLAGAAFFAVTLSPVLGFVDSTYMQWSFVADRYQYLASLGVIAVLVGAAAHGADKLSGAWRNVGLGVAGAVLVVLGTATWQQASIYRDGVTFFSHVVALNPHARDGYLNLGAALSAAGRTEEALAAALNAVEERPDSADAYGNVGNALIALGRPEEAERYLRRGWEIDPEHRATILNLALALELQERYAEALEVYAAEEFHPEDIKVHVARAATMIRAQQYAETIEYLAPAAAMVPPSTPWIRHLFARLHAQRSVSARKLGRIEEAEAHRRRARTLGPRDPGSVLSLAESLRKYGRYEEALEWYGAVIELDPGSGPAHAAMGDTLFHMQRYTEAMDHLAQALALLRDPSLASRLHVLLARSAQALGRPDVAAEHSGRALASNPRDPDALRALILWHFERQEHEAALKLLRTLSDMVPGNAEVHTDIGIVLHLLDRPGEALESLDRALDLDPALEKARTTREQVLQRLRERGQ